MPFFSQSGSSRSKMLNEHCKRSANSAINIVYRSLFSCIEKQISVHTLLPILLLPFMLNHMASSVMVNKMCTRWPKIDIECVFTPNCPLPPGNRWKILWFACPLSAIGRCPLITGCLQLKTNPCRDSEYPFVRRSAGQVLLYMYMYILFTVLFTWFICVTVS